LTSSTCWYRILEIPGVRAEQHRFALCHGLQGVVAADGLETAADEADGRLPVPVRQFAHGVAQQHPATGVRLLAAAAPGVGHAALLEQL
jgi:hypothetical protein